MKTGKELTLEWFERVWNNGDKSAISELLCESCDVQGLNLEEKGPSGFNQFHDAYCNAFGNIRVEVIEMIEEEDVVLGHAKFIGKHRSSGEDIEMLFSYSLQWKEGKAVRARNIVDFTGLLSQIGAIDSDAVEKAIQS